MRPIWRGIIEVVYQILRFGFYGAAVFFTFLGVVAVIVPNMGGRHRRSTIRACYANQKTIAGAVEMYNLDYGTSITTLDTKVMRQTLKRNGYLQSIPQDPGCGKKSAHHYELDNGDIQCRVHGRIQGALPKGYVRLPERNPDRERSKLRNQSLAIALIPAGVLAAWLAAPVCTWLRRRMENIARGRYPVPADFRPIGVYEEDPISGVCPICSQKLGRDKVVWCRHCRTPHHEDCWLYFERCAVYACGSRSIENGAPRDTVRGLPRATRARTVKGEAFDPA